MRPKERGDLPSLAEENLYRIKKKMKIEDNTIPRITPYTIKELCKKHHLFQTIELNEKIYLHYQGFKKIESLEGLSDLKSLWLQGNCI